MLSSPNKKYLSSIKSSWEWKEFSWIQIVFFTKRFKFLCSFFLLFTHLLHHDYGISVMISLGNPVFKFQEKTWYSWVYEKIACALDMTLSCPASRNASVLLCQRLLFPFLKPAGWQEDLGQAGTHPQHDSCAAPSGPSPGYIQAVSPPSAATALLCLLLVPGLPDAWWHWFFPWDCFSDYDNRNVIFIHTQKIQKEQLRHEGTRINKSCSLQLCVRTGGVHGSAPANVCM